MQNPELLPALLNSLPTSTFNASCFNKLLKEVRREEAPAANTLVFNSNEPVAARYPASATAQEKLRCDFHRFLPVPREPLRFDVRYARLAAQSDRRVLHPLQYPRENTAQAGHAHASVFSLNRKHIQGEDESY